MAEGGIGALRVAVLGCGRMGRAHVDAIRSIGGKLDLVVCDPSPVAREWAAATNLRAFSDLEGALSAGELDAVVIAATTSSHAELVAAALDRGIAVLCEKPGGTSPSALRELGRSADAQGRVLRLAYWHRFVPALRRVRDAAGDGAFGDVLGLSSAQWDGEPPTAAFLAGSGGELVDMGVHEIDFARWALGEELRARGAAWRSDPSGHNAAVGVLQSDGGTVVTVSAGRVLEGGRDGCWLEVLGTRASTFDRWLWGDEGESVTRRAVRDQDRAFLELAAGHPSSDLASAEDGAAVLALANALTDAATDTAALPVADPGSLPV